MRILKRKTLLDFADRHASSREALLVWFEVVEAATWKTPNDVKLSFRSVDVLSSKRLVFNIKGNQFRLIADVEFSIGIVFITWIGTHAEYDKINAKTISYGN